MEVSGTSLITAVASVPLLYLIYKSISRPKNFPPGPVGIPIIGSLQYLKEYPERDMLDLAKKYGNVFSLKLFTQNYVCVCGTEANKEVLLNKDICDRSASYIFHLTKGSKSLGVVHRNYGDFLKSFHELSHLVYTDAKCVINNANLIIKQETNKIIEELEDFFQDNEPKSIRPFVESMFINVTMSTLFGSKFEITEGKKAKTIEVFQHIIQLFDLADGILFLLPEVIPGLKHVWLPESARNFLSVSDKIFNYISNQIKIHINTLNPSKPRDLIDLYLIKMQNHENSEFTELDLRNALYDMLFAGSVNSSRTLEYATLYLAVHQNIQTAIYDEIENILLSGSEIKFEDRIQMPYTFATMHEVFRLSNATPIGVPRVASKDLKVCGFSIPEGTIFLLNSYSSHTQEDKWKNPMRFDPGNFLTENKEFVPNPAYMPFGGGLRKCVGAPLIEKHLFIFLIKLVQKYHILPESGDKELDLEPLSGLLRVPKEQKIHLKLRN